MYFMCVLRVALKEHNHVLAHAQGFDFWRGGQEFKDAPEGEMGAESLKLVSLNVIKCKVDVMFP